MVKLILKKGNYNIRIIVGQCTHYHILFSCTLIVNEHFTLPGIIWLHRNTYWTLLSVGIIFYFKLHDIPFVLLYLSWSICNNNKKASMLKQYLIFWHTNLFSIKLYDTILFTTQGTWHISHIQAIHPPNIIIAE